MFLYNLFYKKNSLSCERNFFPNKKGGCYEKDFCSINTATISIIPETKVQAGEYEHSINVPNGNYVVVYYLNGNINSKKVSVK